MAAVKVARVALAGPLMTLLLAAPAQARKHAVPCGYAPVKGNFAVELHRDGGGPRCVVARRVLRDFLRGKGHVIAVPGPGIDSQLPTSVDGWRCGSGGTDIAYCMRGTWRSLLPPFNGSRPWLVTIWGFGVPERHPHACSPVHVNGALVDQIRTTYTGGWPRCEVRQLMARAVRQSTCDPDGACRLPRRIKDKRGMRWRLTSRRIAKRKYRLRFVAASVMKGFDFRISARFLPADNSP